MKLTNNQKAKLQNLLSGANLNLGARAQAESLLYRNDPTGGLVSINEQITAIESLIGPRVKSK